MPMAIACEIVADDAEIVERHMGELGTTGTFTDRPDIGRACFEPFVDLDVTASIHCDTGDIEPDPRGIGTASGRDQDVAAFDGLSPEPVSTRRATCWPDWPS